VNIGVFSIKSHIYLFQTPSRCGPYGYNKRNNSGGNICNKTNKTRNMKKKIRKKEPSRARQKNDSGSGCYLMSVTHVSMNLPFTTKRAGTLKVRCFFLSTLRIHSTGFEFSHKKIKFYPC